MSGCHVIPLLLSTSPAGRPRIELMGIAVIFAILALGAMLLRGALVRVLTVGALVVITISAVAVWFGQWSGR
jgi:hypothetical protein